MGPHLRRDEEGFPFRVSEDLQATCFQAHRKGYRLSSLRRRRDRERRERLRHKNTSFSPRIVLKQKKASNHFLDEERLFNLIISFRSTNGGPSAPG